MSLEATEVLDRVREGADRLRNNTNSFLSGELLSLVPVRINVSGELEENSLRIKSVQRHHSGITDGMIIIINYHIQSCLCTLSFFFFFNMRIIIHNHKYDTISILKKKLLKDLNV